jgi:hypothetical protein
MRTADTAREEAMFSKFDGEQLLKEAGTVVEACGPLPWSDMPGIAEMRLERVTFRSGRSIARAWLEEPLVFKPGDEMWQVDAGVVGPAMGPGPATASAKAQLVSETGLRMPDVWQQQVRLVSP